MRRCHTEPAVCFGMRKSTWQGERYGKDGYPARVGASSELWRKGTSVFKKAGEQRRTEMSTKFTPAGVADDLHGAGLTVADTWTDPAGDYLLTLARPSGNGPA